MLNSSFKQRKICSPPEGGEEVLIRIPDDYILKVNQGAMKVQGALNCSLICKTYQLLSRLIIVLC